MAHKDLSPLAELVKTRLREFYREPAIVFWVFVFPLLMALGLGAAFRAKEMPIPLLAVVLDFPAKNTRSISNALLKSERVDAHLASKKQALNELALTKVDAIVTLQKAHIDFQFDPKKESGPVAQMIADDILQEAAGRKDPLTTSVQAIIKPGSRYIDFLIPGLIAMNLMGSSMWGIGFNLVVTRKRKLLRRYAVTPMKRYQFLFSYLVSRAIFLAVELLLLVGFGVLMFGTKVQGSYFTLVFISTLGAAAYAGIGLIVGARIDNTETANGWMNFVQLPMYVLSGAFFSYERFPQWMHRPLEMLPLTALVNALRATYNEGATIVSLTPEILVLIFWCLFGFLTAVKIFRWQ